MNKPVLSKMIYYIITLHRTYKLKRTLDQIHTYARIFAHHTVPSDCLSEIAQFMLKRCYDFKKPLLLRILRACKA